MDSREFHLEVTAADAHQPPVALLAQVSGLTHRAIKDAMGKGAVWIGRSGNTRRLRRHKAALKEGDELHLYYNPGILSGEAPPATLIADEGDYSVWDKPPGMLSQGSRWGDHTSITRFAEIQLQKVAFLVHRLDRAASGLILVAHTKGAARELAALFEQRKVKKLYQVWVHGRFPDQPGHYEAPLDGRSASTHASLMAYDPYRKASLLRIRIDTGRKHQIRRHLADAGFPVIGDRLYGEDAPENGDLQLRAVELAFEYQGQARDYSAP